PEADTKRRASLNLVEGEAGLRQLDPGGVEIFTGSRDETPIDLSRFAAVLQSENHTLKRALTDPRLFSGIGNAYSDEILFAAQLSPVMLTGRLSDEQVARLYEQTKAVLSAWCQRLQTQAEENFPEKVTAFRPEMAVHGRFG